MERQSAKGLLTALGAALLLLSATLLSQGCSGGGGSATQTEPPPFPPAITLTPIASGFSSPVQITHAADGSGRLFVVEQGGTVRIIRGGALLPAPFLDLSTIVTPQQPASEQGLLAIAFPPGFAQRRHFYVHYTDRTGIGNTVIARYLLSADPDRADATSREQLLTAVQPFANHNGGQLAFGPDGLLYIGLGDGGSGGDPFGNGQNLSTLLGKVLRIDVLSGQPPYAVPPGNPFGSEVWAYGLRNPWRFSFDRLTGDLYIADVGENLFEEVNFQPAADRGGENYGWNVMEGLHCFANPACSQAGLTLPVAEYDHSAGNCAVIGGFVYRGNRNPALQGIYLYGDLCSGRIWGLRRSGGVWESRLLLASTLNISTFGEDEEGEVYVADYRAGEIFRIDLP